MAFGQAPELTSDQALYIIIFLVVVVVLFAVMLASRLGPIAARQGFSRVAAATAGESRAGMPTAAMDERAEQAQRPSLNKAVSLHRLPYVPLSLAEEQLWKSVAKHFTAQELELISPDLKWRDIAGSRFIAPHTAKQLHYLVNKVKAQTEWIPKVNPSTLLERQASEFPMAAEFRRLVLPVSVHGNDARGNPLVLFDFPAADWKQAAKISFAPRQLIDYVALHQEALMLAVRRHSALTDAYAPYQPPYTALFDFNGLTIAKCKQGLDLGFSQIAALWGDQYPETLAKVYVCNAPLLLMFVWRIVSPFIEADTLKKIRILGPGAQVAEFEKDYIPLSAVPISLGGESKGEYIVHEHGRYDGQTPATPAQTRPETPDKEQQDKAMPSPAPLAASHGKTKKRFSLFRKRSQAAS